MIVWNGRSSDPSPPSPGEARTPGRSTRADRVRGLASLAVTLLALVSSILASPRLALAGGAEDAALLAQQTAEDWCAETAADSTTVAARALGNVAPVYSRVAQTYDRTGAVFLLYWRAVLGECLGQIDRSADDYRAFMADAVATSQFPQLAEDARNRLRRRGLHTSTEAVRTPWLILGLSGGYQFGLSEGSADHHYGTFSLEASFRAVGPLRIDAAVQLGISGEAEPLPGVAADPGRRSLLLVVAVGPSLLAQAMPSPRVGLRLLLAPNNAQTMSSPVLLGLALAGGLDIGIGGTPVAVRIGGDLGFLGSTSSPARLALLARLTAGIAISF